MNSLFLTLTEVGCYIGNIGLGVGADLCWESSYAAHAKWGDWRRYMKRESGRLNRLDCGVA